ncbi:MAG: SAM-dependent chlorinase/fluorinase [Chitinophagaceae bacterium]
MALLTLTSDIGLQDYLAGAIKGQLLSIHADFRLVDISHSITPFNYSQAAYICRNSFWQFPPHTFHMVLVNLFETYPTHFLLAYHNEQYIAIADNGLLGLICDGKPQQVVSIPLEKNLVKTTLNCTRALAQSIKALLDGKPFHLLGKETDDIIMMNALQATYGENYLEGQIIHIDHFENVVINITKDVFEKHRNGRRFKLVFKRDETISKISETYADVQQNDKLAMFNSAGYLEIAINKGNAAGLFGLQVFKNETQAAFQQSRLFYQKVRIFFEE